MLKVIGAGFGRTGTASLKAALETLGFGPCYHMFEVVAHPEHVETWDRAALGESVDFARFFQDWNATVDWPAGAFYRDLMTAFPEAKVLLSVRDPDRWYESCLKTIYHSSANQDATPNPEIATDPEKMSHWLRRRMIDHLIWGGTFHHRFEDRAYAIGVYQRHIRAVKRDVPPERLLVFDVKEGWEPLCRFLGVPVPDGEPFPHLNDSASFLQQMPRPIK